MAGDRRDSAVRRVLPIVIVAVAVWRVVFLLRPDGARGIGDAVSAAGPDAEAPAFERSDVAAVMPSSDTPHATADTADGRPRPPRGFTVSLSCAPTHAAPLRLDSSVTRRAAPATADGVRTTGLKSTATPDGFGVTDTEDEFPLTGPVLGETPGTAEGISEVRPAPGP